MRFKPEDFEIFKLTFAGIPVIGASEACSIANAKLEEWLKSAPVVMQTRNGGDCWYPLTILCSDNTKYAKLVSIKELEEKL